MENSVVYDAVEGVKLKADELLSDCESIGGGINSIQSSVTQLLGNGTVKSVQRGEVHSEGLVLDKNAAFNTYSDFLLASISGVNLSKAILIAPSFRFQTKGGSGRYAMWAEPVLKSTGVYMAFRVNQEYNSGVSAGEPVIIEGRAYSENANVLSWQVIEFY